MLFLVKSVIKRDPEDFCLGSVWVYLGSVWVYLSSSEETKIVHSTLPLRTPLFTGCSLGPKDTKIYVNSTPITRTLIPVCIYGEAPFLVFWVTCWKSLERDEREHNGPRTQLELNSNTSFTSTYFKRDHKFNRSPFIRAKKKNDSLSFFQSHPPVHAL